MGEELFELNERTTERETQITEAQLSTGVTGNIREAVLSQNPKAYDRLFEIGDNKKNGSPATIPLNDGPVSNRSSEDVTISFNVAGSSFAQPLRYDLHLAGKSNMLLKKDGEVGKYKKGEEGEEYIYEENGKTTVLKGKEVEDFVSRKVTETYGEPASFRRRSGGVIKTIERKDIRVKQNSNNGYDYSISGPRVDILWSKNVGAFNIGDYSIEETRMNIRDIGRDHLMTLANDEKFMKGNGIINFDFTGHSRGGVGAVQGAMMLKQIVENEYPSLKDRVKFSVLLYDPVPGPKNRVKSNINQAVNLREQTSEMANEGMAAFGENDKAVVVYSMGCNHEHGFDPMKVLGADTVIMTGQNHDEGLKDTEMQFGKKTRQAYINAENCEAYRADGLRDMPKGVFVSDENKVMVRMNNINSVEDVIQTVLKNPDDRTRRIVEVCTDLDARNGGIPSIDVITRGFNAHDPIYVHSSKEFRDMRQQFDELSKLLSAEDRDMKALVSKSDSLRKSAMTYLSSKIGEEPYSNRTQGRMNVARNILRLVDGDRDRMLNWNIRQKLVNHPDEVNVQKAFLNSTKKSYEQTKNYLSDVSRHFLKGNPVDADIFKDSIVSMMADKYFISHADKYTKGKDKEFDNKLSILMGDGSFSLAQTFANSKTIKTLCERMSTEEMANVFSSPENTEKSLDALINSAVNEKFMEVTNSKIKSGVERQGLEQNGLNDSKQREPGIL